MEKRKNWEQEIDETKSKIADLMIKIEDYKNFHPDYKNEGVYKSMAAEITRLQNKMVKLKQTRKVAISDLRMLRWKIFKELVAEKIGQEEMEALFLESKECMKQYTYDVKNRRFNKKL